MTCVPSTTFRLLDDRVGWDTRAADGLAGVVIEGGALQLAASGPEPAPPPRLAWTCDDCTWWLGGPEGILRLGPCDDEFHAWRDVGNVIALAGRDWVLVALVEGVGVLVFDAPGARVIGRLDLPDATGVGFDRRGHVLVAASDGTVLELDLSALPCGTRTDPIEPQELPGLTGWTEQGFCLEGRGCFDWDGRRIDPSELADLAQRYVRQGQFLTEPLDSGIARCRWHRVRLDVDLPAGTSVEVAIATTDGPPSGRGPHPDPAPPWNGFPAGDPHPSDWFDAGPGVIDTTIGAPPGRYAYLRVRLTGDGTATPAVHQIRLDLPRRTSLDDLPAVFAADAEARDFSERFLSLFDAELEETDEVVARRAALLDPDALPDDALGWLAGLLGLGFEAEMTVAQRRALIARAPSLYRRRGTPRGLVETLSVALGVDATVEELGPMRPWGAVGDARVGSVRLFGRSRARVRLGTSALGTAPLNARGNPDDDARLAGVNRIRVHVGPHARRALVERVVRSQVPAHVAVGVHAPRSGLVLTRLRLGLDTVLTAPPPAVVGELRLRRGVLRRGRASRAEAVVGGPLVVGSTTGME